MRASFAIACALCAAASFIASPFQSSCYLVAVGAAFTLAALYNAVVH